MVGGLAAAVDGSTIGADANRERKDQPEAMQKIWAAKDEVTRPVRDYLDQLAADAGEVHEGPQHKAPKYLPETDPQAAWSLPCLAAQAQYRTPRSCAGKGALIPLA